MVSIEDRFNAKIRIDGDCHIWTASTLSGGRYGAFADSGTVRLAHRWAYEHFVGPIPEGLVLDHVVKRGCKSTLCVNVDHLEPVTQSVNTHRGNGPAAKNALKTHCPKDHEYTEENTEIDKRGKRSCRECHRARMRKK